MGVLVYVGVLVLLPFIACTPRKPFCQFYPAIRSRMTREDVRGEFARRFRVNGRFARPVEVAVQVRVVRRFPAF